MKKNKSKGIEEAFPKDKKEGELKEKELIEIYSRRVPSLNFTENQLNLDKEKLYKQKIKNQYLFILGLVLIYLSPMFLDSYTAADNNLNFGTSSSISLFFYIFFYVFLSFLILGENIYFHQIIFNLK